jgi:hypothetical protein
LGKNMTLNEMLTDLQTRIGSTPEVESAQMTPWLNQAYLAFCNAYDFTWLEQIAQASTVADQDRYTLPSDCKRILEMKIDDERYFYVPFEQRDTLDTSVKWFTIIGTEFIINPTPEETKSANIEIVYFKRPEKMVEGTDSPDLLPEVYHEALVIYAFSIYNTYDEEHDEARALMGNELRPNPGTFYWYVQTAKREEQHKKRGARNRMMSAKKYHKFNNESNTTTVLGS